MRTRIVYTRNDGAGIDVCIPTAECILGLTSGGYWDEWGMPRGFLQTQIERNIAEARAPDVARRFVNGLAFGGLTTKEALGLIVDRDCAHVGRLIECFDVDDMPKCRRYRDAWKRSANGGPIGVDLEKARPIQFRAIVLAVESENRCRAFDLNAERELVFDRLRIARAIRHARDEQELARVWPEELAA